MTNLGSLTTTFTPPASCTTNTPQIYQVWEGSKYQYIHGPLYTTDSNCFPDGHDANPTNYYNPGFCPKGYTSASCSRSGLPVTETEARGEIRTAVVCCPSGSPAFTCADNTVQALACTTTFPKSAEVQMGVTIVSDGTVGAYTTVSERRGGIGAYGVQVVLGAMPDGRVQPSEQDTSGATATATSLPTPAATNDPSPPTTSSSSSSSGGGVSTGAAIGIGVGSAAAALIATGSMGLFFFTRWRRKKRLRRRGTTGTMGTRNSKGGGGGGPGSRNGPPVPPKDMQPHYELSEEACSYVAASDRDRRLSSRHMSMLSDARSAGTSVAIPPLGQPVEPERTHLSPVWQSPNQSPSQSPGPGPGPSRSASHAYSYNRPVEHPGHQFAELEAVVPMEAASSDMPSSAEPSLMTPSRWQSLQSLKSRTGSPAPTTNLQDLPEGGTISSTMTGPAGMDSVTNSWASRGRYGERGMSPTPWI